MTGVEGIIYVAHGSQKTDKNQMMRSFYQQLKAERQTAKQGLAFLEKHPDSLTVVAERLLQQGVTRLWVVPLLLFSAKHKEEDIENELAVVKEKYPAVAILVSETFGQEQEVIDLLLARINGELAKGVVTAKTPVLLIAHGSSTYPKPGQVVAEIAAELTQRSGVAVATGLLYGGESYAAQAKGLLAKDDQLVVVPFFLFDGHLLDKIKNNISAVVATLPATKRVYYTETLNLDHSMTGGVLRLLAKASAAD